MVGVSYMIHPKKWQRCKDSSAIKRRNKVQVWLYSSIAKMMMVCNNISSCGTMSFTENDCRPFQRSLVWRTCCDTCKETRLGKEATAMDSSSRCTLKHVIILQTYTCMYLLLAIPTSLLSAQEQRCLESSHSVQHGIKAIGLCVEASSN